MPVADQPAQAFECLIYDADLPSMSVRFQAPEGFPIAGGIYRIERVRTATAEDRQRWARYALPPELGESNSVFSAFEAECG